MSDNAMAADVGTDRLRRELETEAAAWADRGETGGLLDRARLHELDGWLRVDGAGAIAISETATSFVAASRAAARRPRWWPSQTTVGGSLAILLILLILATPVTLLSIVGFTAALIHRVLN